VLSILQPTYTSRREGRSGPPEDMSPFFLLAAFFSLIFAPRSAVVQRNLVYWTFRESQIDLECAPIKQVLVDHRPHSHL
jgi:hypothetical protein